MRIALILLAIIAPIVIVKPLQDAVVLPKLVTTAVFTGTGLVWAGALLIRGRLLGERWAPTVWVPLLAFVAVNIVAELFARDWRSSLMGQYLRYQGLATTLLYVLLFALAAIAVRTKDDLRWVLLGVLAGAIGTAVYALIQKAGLDWVAWSGQGLDRPASTVGQADALGAYLVAVFGASGFLFFTARVRWQQLAIGTSLVAVIAACLFTSSRAGYIGAFAVIVAWSVAAALWFTHFRLGVRPSRAQAVIASVAGIGIATLVVVLGASLFVGLGHGQARFAQPADTTVLQDQSVGGRLSLWQLAVRMTGDRPLWGFGQDAFAHLFARYRDRPDLPGIGTANIEPESAHNFFLDLAVGTGIPGVLAFLVLVGAVLWKAVRRSLETDDSDTRLALVATSSGVLGYLVALFFGFSEAMTTWLFWLLLGAMVGLVARVRTSPRIVSEEPARGRPSWFTAFAAVGLTLLGVIAIGWAVTLTAADLAAGQASRSNSNAARLIERSVSLNPLQKRYLSQRALIYQDAAVLADDRIAALRQAVQAYETLVQRFQPTAHDTLELASTRYDLAQLEGASDQEALDLMERAVELDPYNFPLRSLLAEFLDANGYRDRAFKQRLEMVRLGESSN